MWVQTEPLRLLAHLRSAVIHPRSASTNRGSGRRWKHQALRFRSPPLLFVPALVEASSRGPGQSGAKRFGAGADLRQAVEPEIDVRIRLPVA